MFIMLFTTNHALAAATDSYQRYYAVMYKFIEYRSGLSAEWVDWLTQSIISLSLKYGIDPLLVTAFLAQESNFRMTATSDVGAIGISQLMPDTARSLGVDPYKPDENLEGGIRYLANQIDSFRNCGEWSLTYAVAAYNAGPGAIVEYNGLPPYRETIEYVKIVGNNYQNLLNQL